MYKNTLQRIQHIGYMHDEKFCKNKTKRTIINLGCNCNKDDAYLYITKNEEKIKEVHLLDCAPNAIEKCKQLYKESVSPEFFEKIHFHHYAIVENPEVETVNMYYPVDDDASGFSSTLPSMVAINSKNDIVELEVPAITINNFFKKIQVQEINRLYIDLEGLDGKILLDLDFDKYYVPYIMYEHLHLDGCNNYKPQNPSVSSLIHKKLSMYHYKVYAYGPWNGLAISAFADLQHI
jgi:FkbM family methyltransferase